MIFSLPVDQDWVHYNPPENSILKFLGKSYDKDKMRTLFVFRLIGEPVKDEPITEIILS